MQKEVVEDKALVENENRCFGDTNLAAGALWSNFLRFFFPLDGSLSFLMLLEG